MAENLEEKKKSLIEREKEVRRRGDDLERLEEELERRQEKMERQARAVSLLNDCKGRAELFASNKIVDLLNTMHKYYRLVRYYRLFQSEFESVDGKCFMKIHSEIVA